MSQRLTHIALLGVFLTTTAFAGMPSALVEQVKKITAADAAADDQFGVSVALSGTTALVGARYDDDAGDDSGSAYVFERDQGGAGNWGQVAKITADDAAANVEFGRAVALSGTTAFVGAYQDNAGGLPQSGSVYVFERDEGGAGNWGQVAKITADDAAAGDAFGISIALSGSTAIVGADRDDGRVESGSAYVFERDQGGMGNWGQVAKIKAIDASAQDRFGNSVALSGTTVLVGAHLDDDFGQQSGSAYVFERDQGGADNWGQVAKITAKDAGSVDFFGYAVALDGTTAIIGAYREDDGGSDSGSVYVFERDQGGAGNWGQVIKMTANDAAMDDNFGYAVALSGTTAFVGAPGNDDDGSASGSTYVFERDQGGAGNWGQVVKITSGDAAMDDNFGYVVALNGATAIVGALGDDDGGSGSGSAYLLKISIPIFQDGYESGDLTAWSSSVP